MPPDTISVSQINLYLTCSLKYRFQYIDRLPKLTQAAGLVFGSAIHATLEWLHKEQKRGRTPPLDELLRVFEGDWHAQLTSGTVAFDNGDERDKLVVKGKELLSLFYYLPPKAVRDAEVFFQLPLVNPATGEVLDLPLRGVIDAVYDDDTIDEFKTSAKRYSPDEVLEQLQLTAYDYAFAKLYGRPAKELRLVNLLKTKKPDIHIQTTGREEADHERLFHMAKALVAGVRANAFLPNRGCWMCKDCEYDQDCREWRGNEP